MGLGAPLAALCITLAGSVYITHSFFLKPARDGRGGSFVLVGDAIAGQTRADEIVMLYGLDWDPTVQFRSDRYTVMARSPGPAAQYTMDQGIEPGLAVFCHSERDKAQERLEAPLYEGQTWTLRKSVAFCDIYGPGQAADVPA